MVKVWRKVKLIVSQPPVALSASHSRDRIWCELLVAPFVLFSCSLWFLFPILSFRAPVSLPTGCWSPCSSTQTMLTLRLAIGCFCCRGFPAGHTASWLLRSATCGNQWWITSGLCGAVNNSLFVKVSSSGWGWHQAPSQAPRGACRLPLAISWAVSDTQVAAGVLVASAGRETQEALLERIP